MKLAQSNNARANNAQTPAAPPVVGRMIPVTQWNEYHPWPPAGGMRHLVFNAETNGFAHAFVRVGRRVLVDEAEFFAAVRAKRAA